MEQISAEIFLCKKCTKPFIPDASRFWFPDLFFVCFWLCLHSIIHQISHLFFFVVSLTFSHHCTTFWPFVPFCEMYCFPKILYGLGGTSLALSNHFYRFPSYYSISKVPATFFQSIVEIAVQTCDFNIGDSVGSPFFNKSVSN